MSNASVQDSTSRMLDELEEVIALLSRGEEVEASVRCFSWLPVIICVLFHTFDVVTIGWPNGFILASLASVLCASCMLGLAVSHWTLYQHRVALSRWSHTLCVRYPHYFAEARSLCPELGWHSRQNLRGTIHVIKMQRPSVQYVACLRRSLQMQTMKIVFHALFFLHLTAAAFWLFLEAHSVEEHVLAFVLLLLGVTTIVYVTSSFQDTVKLRQDYKLLQLRTIQTATTEHVPVPCEKPANVQIRRPRRKSKRT